MLADVLRANAEPLELLQLLGEPPSAREQAVARVTVGVIVSTSRAGRALCRNVILAATGRAETPVIFEPVVIVVR